MKTYTFNNIQAFQWKTEDGYNEIVRQSYEGSDGLQLVPAGYTMQGISKPAIKTANGPQRITSGDYIIQAGSDEYIAIPQRSFEYLLSAK